MHISKLKINNFRLLKDTEIKLEEEISYIIGKNNSGKTSILSILNNFINLHKFSFYDFHIDIQTSILTNLVSSTIKDTEKFIDENKITLSIEIEYTEEDNLEKLSSFIVDLDVANSKVYLICEYTIIDNNALANLVKSIQSFDNTEKIRKFLLKNNNMSNYWKVKIFSIYQDNIKEQIDEKKLTNIINFYYISAKREGDNDTNKEPLSKLLSNFISNKSDNKSALIEPLEVIIDEINTSLTTQYAEICKELLQEIKQNTEDTKVTLDPTIASTFDIKTLLNYDNKTLMYKEKDNNVSLPEYYNGLGVLNFISILIQLENIQNLEDTKKVNLFFIEEPEVHTHPQMQYTFVTKIKKHVEKYQTLITTHSAHIVSKIDYDCLYYLYKDGTKSEFKKLKDFTVNNNEREDDTYFLKQYLTLNASELFFAEKVILIEGTTERILLPLMMQKHDKDHNTNLLSQNISILEIGGRHAHVFAKFLEFIGTKNLIITDWDYQQKTDKKEENTNITTNSCITEFYPCINNNNSYSYDKSYSNKIMLTTQQKNQNSYQAYSFEDAFLSIEKNYNLIKSKASECQGLKNRTSIQDYCKDNNFKQLADKIINKKSVFAIDIFILAKDIASWETPNYIKKGLEWLNTN